MAPEAVADQSPPVEVPRRSSAGTSVRIRRLLRQIRKSILGAGVGEPRTPAELTRSASEVVLLSRFYYLFLAFMVGTSRYPFGDAYSGGPPTAPLWPIRLLEQLAGTAWLRHELALMAAGLLFALGAAASPRLFILRFGAFLHLMLHVAIRNSYGSINHGVHVLLLVGFALLFLPGRQSDLRAGRSNVRACLTTLWLAQSVILLTYTLSGVWKIWYGRLELFSSDALTRILLDRSLAEADESPMLLPFVAQRDWLGQSMWWLTLYIEIFALLVVFRPHLHRPIGAVLMMFHITSNLLMGITFNLNIVMVGLFLLLSPLAPARFSLSGTVRSLPIVGIPFRLMKRRQQSQQPRHTERVWLVYDGECPMCNNYAQYLRLQQSVGEFVLVDARQGGPIVDEVRGLPHDLNDGMVVKIGDRFFVGHEALRVLALLAEDRGAFSKFNRLAFRSPLIARLTYPLMRGGRWVLLKLKGVERIDS
ncbi:DCC1-like thiol-disulfide oxidoreductase family protein [Candidatus Poriferisodalis sp.]|uniref:DCC1-like thiol-disulfide oxidoreductase family protein n=1 Tax=Candidatus Poriferisodalis sp. TaxID=3101277 RepID=UPI003B018277